MSPVSWADITIWRHLATNHHCKKPRRVFLRRTSAYICRIAKNAFENYVRLSTLCLCSVYECCGSIWGL